MVFRNLDLQLRYLGILLYSSYFFEIKTGDMSIEVECKDLF